MVGGSCPRQAPQIWSWQWAPGAPCPTSGSPARQRRVEAGPSQAKRQSGRRGRGPCRSHRPAGGRTGASPGRGPGAGGWCSGRGRASDRQPWWLLSGRGNRGSERGSHCPRPHSKVRWVRGLSKLILQIQDHPLPGTEAHTWLGSEPPETLQPPKATSGLVQQNSQGPLSTQPHRRSASRHCPPRPSRLPARATE